MKRTISIFCTGLVVRLVALLYLVHVKPYMLTWGANEAAGIAGWIVRNHSFSSPFHDASGPTAWLAPIYPAVVAAVFWVFGIATPGSAIAVMIFNSICSAAAGVIIYMIAADVHSERAGVFAAWMWALCPYVAILPFIPWDTSLSALLLSAALLLTLRLHSGKSKRWAECGILWGIAALVSPTLFIGFPIIALLLLERGSRIRQVVIMTLFAFVLLLPWTVRNYFAFHQILPIRSNGLAEVYFANCGFETHPVGPSMEYQRLGEAKFIAQVNSRALKYIRTNPAIFIGDCLRRAMWFWIYPISFWPLSVVIDLAALAGIILLFRHSRQTAMLMLVVIAAYPLVYYASLNQSRYRHPIEPILYALGGIGLSELALRRRWSLGNTGKVSSATPSF